MDVSINPSALALARSLAAEISVDAYVEGAKQIFCDTPFAQLDSSWWCGQQELDVASLNQTFAVNLQIAHDLWVQRHPREALVIASEVAQQLQPVQIKLGEYFTDDPDTRDLGEKLISVAPERCREIRDTYSDLPIHGWAGGTIVQLAGWLMWSFLEPLLLIAINQRGVAGGQQDAYGIFHSRERELTAAKASCPKAA